MKIVNKNATCKKKCKNIVKNFDLDLSSSHIHLISFHPT